MPNEIERRVIELTFTERLLGTMPPKEVFERYLMPKAVEENVPQENLDEELETAPEATDTVITSFHKDVDGLYLIDYQIKGFLKESANIIKSTLPGKKGDSLKAAKSKIDNYVFIEPRYIFLKEEPDGIYPRTLRAQTPQGPRVSIAVSHYMEIGTQITFKLVLLPGSEITFPILEACLNYGSFKGIGQFRNGSFGRFEWRYKN